ncbi:MAG: hypothetical protein NVS1B11_18630 [Terriglobales bacterium]
MDSIKVTLLTTLMTLMMGLIDAVMMALNNSVSSNLALSAAALCGTALIFCMQMYFELKNSTDVDHVSTTFTLRHQNPRSVNGNTLGLSPGGSTMTWLQASG